MRELTISPDRTKMLVTLLADGRPERQDRIDPGSSKARRGLIRSLGVAVSEADLLSWLDQTRREASTQRFPLPDERPQVVEEYRVRALTEKADSALVCKINAVGFLKNHLPVVRVDHVIEWDHADDMCCLDVDYHETKPPSRAWLSTIVLTRLTPAPYAWHFSRGGGLHCFYVPAAPFTAQELAAVAALRFRCTDQSAGLELKMVVRGPGVEGVTLLTEPDSGGVALTDWFGTAGTDEDERDEWLEERRMALGSRYDHTLCPIGHTPGHESKGDPVQVDESGVFCHRCAGLGLSLGSRRPGYAPWPALLGSPSSGDVGLMIRHLCHWGHAGWVLRERYGLPDALAKTAYRAALKARHAGTPREELIALAFSPDTADYARSGDTWYSIAKSHAYPRDIGPVIARMPAACHLDDDGKVKSSPAIVCDMLQGKDLSDRGYPDIERVHGFKIAAVHLPPASCRVAVVNPALGARSRPAYVNKTRRVPEADAWAAIETIVPRIDRTLVKVCLCAFGSAQETKSGMLPFLFVSGPAGAAKTGTVKLAAAIFGTRVGAEAVFDPDTTRFRQALHDGAGKGPAVLVNEILKDAGRRKLSAREALDPLLNLTPDSSSWVAYKGPVSFGRIPAIVVTEPVCPLSLRDETQLARRIRHHHVFGRKDEWKRTLAAAGLSDLHLLRNVSPAVNAACDSILSTVCDDFFGTPLTWDEQADTLSVRTIEEDEEFEDLTPALLDFFRLVGLAPDLSGRDAKRYGVGYKRVSRGDQSGEDDDLVSCYSIFADGTGADWLGARRLTEKDWSGILKTDQPVHFDHKSDGASVFVRFRTGRSHKDPGNVNGAIKCYSTNCTST